MTDTKWGFTNGFILLRSEDNHKAEERKGVADA